MNPLDIIFRVRRDGQGGQQVRKELDEIADSAQKADTAAQGQNRAQQDLNKTFGDSARASSAIYHVNMGLSQMASGNILGGIRHLTASLKGLWATMVANPIGAVIAAVGALVMAFSAWRGRVKEQKAAEKELRDELAESAKALADYRAAVDREANSMAASFTGAATTADALTGTGRWAAIAADLKRAADDAERLRIQTEALADLDLAEAMANIDLALASGELSPADADRARAQARVDHGSARRDAARGELDMRDSLAEERQFAARQNAERSREEALQAGIELTRFRSRFHDAGFTQDPELEERDLLRQIDSQVALSWRSGQDPMQDEEYIALNRRLAVLQELMREGEREEDLSTRRIEAARAAAEAEAELAAAREAIAATFRETTFARSVLDRQEAISGTSVAATRQQIENREAEEAARYAEAAQREADRKAAEARREADRAAAQAESDRRDAEREAAGRIISQPPLLPGRREMGDVGGLDSSQAVRRDNQALSQAAEAYNTFRQAAASDGVITPEEASALYALLREFVDLSQTMGKSQQGALRQVETMQRDIENLKAQFANRP